MGGGDAFFAVAPACAHGKIHAEYVFARAVPAVGGHVEHALAVFGNGVAVVPMPPIMPDNNGGAVLVVVPPWVADGKPPAPACEKGFAGDFFYAAGERADGVAAAAVDVVGGGGALKQILIDSGVGRYIGDLLMGSDLSPLVLAWSIAAVIRIACGSATVAALTAGGIAAPVVALTGVSPELMVLATGAGSLIISPPNDPGFWLFKEFFGLTVKETVRTWCTMETIISVLGLAGVLILNMFVG